MLNLKRAILYEEACSGRRRPRARRLFNEYLRAGGKGKGKAPAKPAAAAPAAAPEPPAKRSAAAGPTSRPVRLRTPRTFYEG